MPRKNSSLDEDLLDEVWRLLFDFLIKSGDTRSDSLAARNLTPNDSRALMTLGNGDGQAIGALAKAWRCDPSTATWLVDRLERAGLAERRQAEEDRRVKRVRLTRKGSKMRAELLAEFYRPPPELGALTSTDLRTLQRLLAKL